MASKFIPRQVFPHHGYIPKSYFLGHHKSGLQKMKKKFAQMDYLIECRDYRTPVSSINPAFEELLGDIPDTRRLIVYTKSDLGADQLSQDRMVSAACLCFCGLSSLFYRYARQSKASTLGVKSSSFVRLVPRNTKV